MLTVLVVEGYHAMRVALSKVLASERPGWRIIQARNGQEGVELARAQAPDLILLGGDLSVVSDYQADAGDRIYSSDCRHRLTCQGRDGRLDAHHLRCRSMQTRFHSRVGADD